MSLPDIENNSHIEEIKKEKPKTSSKLTNFGESNEESLEELFLTEDPPSNSSSTSPIKIKSFLSSSLPSYPPPPLSQTKTPTESLAEVSMMDLVRQMQRSSVGQKGKDEVDSDENFGSDDGLEVLEMDALGASSNEKNGYEKEMTDEELTKEVEGALMPNLGIFGRREKEKFEEYKKNEERKEEHLEISDYLDKYKDSEHAIR
jgi:hypothetical protein